MAMLWSCSSTAYVVESDYSYAGTFHRYKSFSFGENKSFGGSEADKVLVEKYIGSVLTAWGYETGASKPDLYVFYSFYFEDFAYRGYNQPYLQQWIHYNHPAYGKELSQLDTGLDSLNNVLNKTGKRVPKEEYDKVTYHLKEGTLLIAFVDRKKKSTVWQGYASGIMGSDGAQNQRVLRSAVIRILDEFKLLSPSS